MVLRLSPNLSPTSAEQPSFARLIANRGRLRLTVLLRWWQIGCSVHVSTLSDWIWLVVLAVDVIACASHVTKEVVAICWRIDWGETKRLRIGVVTAIRHHAETPRDRLGNI